MIGLSLLTSQHMSTDVEFREVTVRVELATEEKNFKFQEISTEHPGGLVSVKPYLLDTKLI